MLPSRGLMSLGLRMTLQCMQDNITSMRNLHRPMLLLQQQQRSFAFSRTMLDQLVVVQQPEQASTPDDKERKPLQSRYGRLLLEFTCNRCKTRNVNRYISKIAYEAGFVAVQCYGCKNYHLFADHLGYFGNDPHMRNIETILRQKGDTVRRVRDDTHGYFEIVTKEVFDKVQKLILEQQEGKTDDVKPVEQLEETFKVENEKVGQQS